MSRVAAIIDGGQALDASLYHGLTVEEYRVAVIDTRSDKVASAAQGTNTEYGENVAYSLGADITSK